MAKIKDGETVLDLLVKNLIEGLREGEVWAVKEAIKFCKDNGIQLESEAGDAQALIEEMSKAPFQTDDNVVPFKK